MAWCFQEQRGASQLLDIAYFRIANCVEYGAVYYPGGDERS